MLPAEQIAANAEGGGDEGRWLYDHGSRRGGGDGGKALVEFKAGKMILTGPNSAGKFNCTADKRKGTVSLVSAPDQLLHFRWADRTSGNVEDDRIIFPGDATFKSVKAGRDEDRVYILKIK